MISDAPYLANLPHDHVERKEWLALLLALLQDTPARLIRDFVRLLCQGQGLEPGQGLGSGLAPGQGLGQGPGQNFGGSGNGLGSGLGSGFGSEGVCHDTDAYPIPLMRLLVLLHLCLDTFEYPLPAQTSGTYASLFSGDNIVTFPFITLYFFFFFKVTFPFIILHSSCFI